MVYYYVSTTDDYSIPFFVNLGKREFIQKSDGHDACRRATKNHTNARSLKHNEQHKIHCKKVFEKHILYIFNETYCTITNDKIIIMLI